MRVQDSSVHTASIPQRMRWRRSQWADEVGIYSSWATKLGNAGDTCCDSGHDKSMKPMWCMSPNHLKPKPFWCMSPIRHAKVVWGLVRRKSDFDRFSAWWDSDSFFHDFFLAELIPTDVNLCETIDVISYYHVLEESMGDAKSMSHSRLTLFVTRCQACGNLR